MSEIRLKTPIDQTFTCAKSGVVWGRIYLEIDRGQFFPNSQWTDMVVAFEVAWLRALLELAGGMSVRESVRFYDGPFVVNLFLQELGSVELNLIHKEEIRSIVHAKCEDLLQEAISAAEDSLSACAERNWSNTDTEALAALLRAAGQKGGSSRYGGAK